ncbi:hypothetical protein D3C78_598240 [compost metagenome]
MLLSFEGNLLNLLDSLPESRRFIQLNPDRKRINKKADIPFYLFTASICNRRTYHNIALPCIPIE